MLKKDWNTIRDGIEVKLCKMPKDEDGEESASTEEVTETFILCRSQARKEKDKAIVERAATKIAERLTAIKEKYERQNRDKAKICIEIGRLKGQNT